MATLLVINSSPKSNSVSRRLTHQFAEDWKARDRESTIIERNLADGSIPLMSEAWIQAAYTPETSRTVAQKNELALSDKLIDELMAADVILLGIPMHNFSVPAAFKAWIDQIARAGKTFSYTDRGPQGLVSSGKKVIAVLTRGGVYQAESANSIDLQESYLRQVLGFIGLTDVTFVHADRQGMGGDAAKQSAQRALGKLASIIEACPTPQAV